MEQPIKTKVKVLSYNKLTDDVFELVIERPKNKHHKPGQFVSIFINDNKKGTCIRAYSVMSDKSDNIQLCIRIVENGRGSNYLSTMRSGNELEIIYPLGNFGLPDKLANNLCFLATGTGIVPIIAMLESLDNNYTGKINVIFGLRYEKDIFYKQRLETLKNKFKNFSLKITISRPSENWKGNKGRITEHLNFDYKDTQFFMCGSKSMITEVRNILEEKKVDKENIFFENF